MTEETSLIGSAAKPLAAFLSTKTGVSTAVITGIITVAVPVITAAVMHKIAYEKGKTDYIADLRSGTAKLDGKTVKVVDEAQREADLAAAALKGEVDGYQLAQNEFAIRQEQSDAAHARAIAALAGRPYTPVEIDWRSQLVPPDIGLRIDKALAAREGSDDQRGLPAVEYRSGIVGYPPGDTDADD